MSRSTRKRWLLVALAVLVVLAGCSGSSGGDAAQATVSDGGGVQTASGDEARASGSGPPTGSKAASMQIQQRELIRTGNVTLTVANFDRSRQNLSAAVEARGGFVSDTDQRAHHRGNETFTTGRVVYRVPKENFSSLVAQVKAEGEVERSGTNTRDVTDQLVDIEARLTNLRAQREKLRDLYENASDTENVLDVQERLSEVQTEIERLEAKRKSLRQRVAYSTVTVELREEPPENPKPERTKWYETGLLAAFSESVHGVAVVARGITVAAAYSAPYVLAFGLPLGGVAVAWRRFG